MGEEEKQKIDSCVSTLHFLASPHQITLFSIYSPAAGTFRASTANFFFPLVLLLGLAISAVPVLYSIFL